MIIIILIILLKTYKSECSDINSTNLDRCKVSHLGVEFSGSVAVSGAFLRCQKWKPIQPIHPVSADIKGRKDARL